MIRCGVIGMGVGAAHARYYNASAACELVAICDSDPSKAADIRAEYSNVPFFTDPSSVLLNPGIDLVSVATFDEVHASQVIMALNAGKHVFVEKPLCTSSSECRDVEMAWKASPGLFLGSNLVLRSSPFFRRLKQLIDAGRLGEIYLMQGDYLYGRLHKLTEGWRGKTDYSVFLGGAIHLLDLLIDIFGCLPVRVNAVGNGICTREASFSGFDCVQAQFEFPKDRIATVSSNYGCVHKHHHHMRIYGTLGTFVYDDAGARLICSRDPAVSPEFFDWTTERVEKSLHLSEFVAAVAECDHYSRERIAKREFGLMSSCIGAVESSQLCVPVEIICPDIYE